MDVMNVHHTFSLCDVDSEWSRVEEEEDREEESANEGEREERFV